MTPTAIFIGGAPRSGTTLLRLMLDSHPEIACGPEHRVIPALANFSAETRRLCGEALQRHYALTHEGVDQIFASLIYSFLEPYREKNGKPRVAEKTPANVLHFTELRRLFPRGYFIHIIRDGRDTVSSLLSMDWKDANGAPMPMTRNASDAAHAWRRHVEAGRAARDERVLEIRYETLVAEPEETLREIFEFLDVAWSDAPLRFYQNPSAQSGMAESSAAQVSKPLYRDSIGKWRKTLSPGDISAIEHVAGGLLHELGYA